MLLFVWVDYMNYVFFIISLLLALLPIILIGYYFYNKDTIKEPKKLLLKLFFSGIGSGLIIIIISIFCMVLFPKYTQLEKINNIYILLFYCFIFVALLEEISKFLMIYSISYNNKEFDQAFDIIIYSVFVGLGFACFENIIYILGSDSNITTAILRGITAVPAHTCFQTIMGYYLYLSKIKDKRKNIILSIIIPIILHGSYDLFIFSKIGWLFLLFIVLLIFIIIYANSKIKKLIEIDKANLKPFCPQCGNKINYQFCSKCGYKKQ